MAAAARRGHVAANETSKDPPSLSPAASSAGDGPRPSDSATQPHQEQQQQRLNRRIQFGPELPPPPPPLDSPGQCSARPDDPALPAGTAAAGGARQAPKRRGRPPKLQAGLASVGQQQQHTGTSVPLAEATAAVAAAVAASAVAPASSGSSNKDSGARKPFGPEPPPPFSAAATSANPPASILPFALPDDPSQLNVDDILDLPLPDPRVGETFRLDGDLSDLGDLADRLGEQLDDDADANLRAAAATAAAAAAAASSNASSNDADVDADLDYDQLIALASRIDAASYVAQAFERAKQGLEPVLDPMLSGVGVSEAKRAPPSASAAAAPSGAEAAGGRTAASSAPAPAATAASVAAAATQAASGYVPPPRPSTDAVYVNGEEDLDGEEDADDEDEDLGAAEVAEVEAAAARRVALLVDLLSASGAELEAKLEAAAPEVDEKLLALLERRYTAALALRQDAASTERVATLYRALRYMYERRTSSAAERLLDDVLSILADEQLQPDPGRRRGEAAARLRNAFTGGMLDVDIFTAAAALAEGRQAAAEALAGETVSLESFKAEAMGLLGHAKRVQQQTAASLETVESEVARLRAEEPGALEGREWRARLEQVRLAQQALAEREESIAALEEVLVLTRAVELQMLTGRMGGDG